MIEKNKKSELFLFVWTFVWIHYYQPPSKYLGYFLYISKVYL